MRPRQILLVGEGTVSDAVRLKLPAEEMTRMGVVNPYFLTISMRSLEDATEPNMDAVIFSRPHNYKMIKAYKRQGVKIIVDMDDDFHAIPPEHPGYKYVGKGDPIYLDALERSIGMADLLTVTTQELADRLRQFNDNIKIIPNGWSVHTPHWNRKHKVSFSIDDVHKDLEPVVIGWAGTITHREDFMECYEAVKDILDIYPGTRIYIGGDHEIYRNFKSIPELRKKFFEMVPYNLYPWLLGYFDILLAPLKDNYFNNAKSDIKLVDAGAKGIPYVASDIPIYDSWSDGGYKVSSDHEWGDALAELVINKEKRETLGNLGKDLALDREMWVLARQWFDAIRSVL